MIISGKVDEDVVINDGGGFSEAFKKIVDQGLKSLDSFVDNASDSYNNAKDKVEDVYQSVKDKVIGKNAQPETTGALPFFEESQAQNGDNSLLILLALLGLLAMVLLKKKKGK